MQELYRHIDDLDLFTAGMAERPVIGGLVGPTFACIIAQQFSNIRKGDRFWYENGGLESSFTPAQLQQIRRISLAQVLCKTLDTIDTIQPFAFMTADKERNERISCDSGFISNFDLSPWTERLSTLDNDISDLEKTGPVKRTTPTKSSPDKSSSNSSLTLPRKSGSLKPTQQTTTTKPTTETTILKVEQNVTENSVNKTNTHKIDDKLDFKNKSRRFADNDTFTDHEFYRARRPYNPFSETIKYNNNNNNRPYQYDNYPIPVSNDDHSYQDSVNNHNYNNGHHRPDKPVITVTENLKDFTYLINYVPTTTASYKNKPHNRDVVKVTYQTYEDTYKRPQPIYLNNQHTIPAYHNNKLIQRPKDSTSKHDLTNVDRQNSDFSATKDLDIDIPARSGDHNTFTKVGQSINFQLTDEFDLRRTSTDFPYKLVTFSHLGTYRHDNKEFPSTYNTKKDDAPKEKEVVLNPPVIRTKTYLTDSTLTTSSKTLTVAKSTMKFDLTTNKPETTVRPKLTTYFNIPSSILQSTVHTTPTTYKTTINKTRPKTTTTLKPGRYYYIGNVLHRYPDSPRTTVVDKTDERRNETHIFRHSLNNASSNAQENKSKLDNRQTDKVSNFNLTDGQKKEGKIRTVKPQGHAHRNTNHQIKFEVIPSENSPSQWAVYDENVDLQDGFMHTMPPMHRDPMALEELPRPINLTARHRPKTKKPSKL